MFEQLDHDNGVKIHLNKFNLDKEFENQVTSDQRNSTAWTRRPSKILTNVLYVVDCYKWWNPVLHDKHIEKHSQKFFTTL